MVLGIKKNNVPVTGECCLDDVTRSKVAGEGEGFRVERKLGVTRVLVLLWLWPDVIRARLSDAFLFEGENIGYFRWPKSSQIQLLHLKEVGTRWDREPLQWKRRQRPPQGASKRGEVFAFCLQTAKTVFVSKKGGLYKSWIILIFVRESVSVGREQIRNKMRTGIMFALYSRDYLRDDVSVCSPRLACLN